MGRLDQGFSFKLSVCATCRLAAHSSLVGCIVSWFCKQLLDALGSSLTPSCWKFSLHISYIEYVSLYDNTGFNIPEINKGCCVQASVDAAWIEVSFTKFVTPSPVQDFFFFFSFNEQNTCSTSAVKQRILGAFFFSFFLSIFLHFFVRLMIRVTTCFIKL